MKIMHAEKEDETMESSTPQKRSRSPSKEDEEKESKREKKEKKEKDKEDKRTKKAAAAAASAASSSKAETEDKDRPNWLGKSASATNAEKRKEKDGKQPKNGRDRAAAAAAAPEAAWGGESDDEERSKGWKGWTDAEWKEWRSQSQGGGSWKEKGSWKESGAWGRNEVSINKKDLEAIVKTLASMTSQHAEDLRDLSSCIFHTWIIDTEGWIAKTFREGGKMYHDTAKALQKEENITGAELSEIVGPPHISLWSLFLCAVFNKKRTDLEQMQKDFPTLNKRDQELRESQGWTEVKGCPRYWRTRRLQHNKTVLLCVFDHRDKMEEDEVFEILRREGADYKQGTPPRKPLERELKRLLEKIGTGGGGPSNSSSSSSSSGKR